MGRRVTSGMALLWVCAADAATTLWTGNVSTDWATAGNWSSGVPAYNTDVVFAGPPTANQPDLNGANRAVNTVDFQSAGWTISGSGYALQVAWGNYFRSTGAGTNTCYANVTYGGNSATAHTLSIGTGNTLVLHGTLAKPRDNTVGDGTLVLTSSSPLPTGDWSFGALRVLLNGAGTIPLQSVNFASGGQLGGTATAITLRKYGWLQFADGGTLSPGDIGQPICTLSIAASANPCGVNMGGSASKLVIDLGSSAGENDRIALGVMTYDFNLNNCELALRGSGPVQDGDYTILTESSADSDYLGTFGSVTYNGAPADPANFSVVYRATSIVVSVVGMARPTATLLMVW